VARVLRDELDNTMAQIDCADAEDLDARYVWRGDPDAAPTPVDQK